MEGIVCLGCAVGTRPVWGWQGNAGLLRTSSTELAPPSAVVLLSPGEESFREDHDVDVEVSSFQGQECGEELPWASGARQGTLERGTRVSPDPAKAGRARRGVPSPA